MPPLAREVVRRVGRVVVPNPKTPAIAATTESHHQAWQTRSIAREPNPTVTPYVRAFDVCGYPRARPTPDRSAGVESRGLCRPVKVQKHAAKKSHVVIVARLVSANAADAVALRERDIERFHAGAIVELAPRIASRIVSVTRR